ncbi:MAG: hypothetical protein GXZ08_07640 [Tissierellia bacterium]|nr:hypothetical protein [Tissierellia bacterium]
MIVIILKCFMDLSIIEKTDKEMEMNRRINKISLILSICVILSGLYINFIDVFAARETEVGLLDVVYLNGYSDDENKNESIGSKENPAKTFKEAKELLASDGTIIITGNIVISGDEVWDLLVKGTAKVHRGFTDPSDKTIIDVPAGSSLELSNIVIDGIYVGDIEIEEDSADAGTLISVTGGELVMKDGAVLQNNRAIINNAGAVFITNNGTFLMEGGVIANCMGKNGGAVRIDNREAHQVDYINGGVFQMSGKSKLTSNEAYQGGAVYLNGSNSKFIMDGGLIEKSIIVDDETSLDIDYGGAAVAVFDGAEFVMNNGSINGNKNLNDGGSGGAVLVGGQDISALPIEEYHSSGKFIMNGGTISDNKASFGGGVYIGNIGEGYQPGDIVDGEFTMNGGIIENNIAVGSKLPGKLIPSGGGVYLESGTAKIFGDSIIRGNIAEKSGNSVEKYGDGVYVGDSKFYIDESIDINSDNDVFLASNNPGKPYYINVRTPYDGICKFANKMHITTNENAIGTKIVHYPSSAGGDESANNAMIRNHYIISKYHTDGDDFIPEIDTNEVSIIQSETYKDYLVYGNKVRVNLEIEKLVVGTGIPSVDTLYNFTITKDGEPVSGKYSIDGGIEQDVPSNGKIRIKSGEVAKLTELELGCYSVVEEKPTDLNYVKTYIEVEDRRIDDLKVDLVLSVDEDIRVKYTNEFKKDDDPVNPNPWWLIDGGDDGILNKKDHFAYMIGYPEGVVIPEGDITRAEVATIFFRMMTDEAREKYWSNNNNYSDVDYDAWYNNAISTLSNAGAIKGYEDGSFKPNDFITRGEFAAMASRFLSETGTLTKNNFTDVKGNWAEESIEKLVSLGMIKGYEDGSFKPEQRITRAETATLVNAVLERTPHKDNLLKDMKRWTDNMDEDKWYYAQIQEATNSHIYERVNVKSFENWTRLLPVRDWAALEREWSNANSSSNPGDVSK